MVHYMADNKLFFDFEMEEDVKVNITVYMAKTNMKTWREVTTKKFNAIEKW